MPRGASSLSCHTRGPLHMWGALAGRFGSKPSYRDPPRFFTNPLPPDVSTRRPIIPLQPQRPHIQRPHGYHRCFHTVSDDTYRKYLSQPRETHMVGSRSSILSASSFAKQGINKGRAPTWKRDDAFTRREHILTEYTCNELCTV